MKRTTRLVVRCVLIFGGWGASLAQADVIGYCCDREVVLGSGSGIDRCFDCAKFMQGAPFEYRGRLEHALACGAIYETSPRVSDDPGGMREAICSELKQAGALCPAVAAGCDESRETTFTDQAGKRTGENQEPEAKPPEECDDFYPPPDLCPPPAQICREAIQTRENELEKLKKKNPDDRSPTENLKMQCLELNLRVLRDCCNTHPCEGVPKLEAEIQRKKEVDNAIEEDLQHLRDWLEELRKDCKKSPKQDDAG